MDKQQEKRLNDLATSSIVGGDIAAALKEIETLRSLEKQYAERLGNMARLCDTVCKWVIGDGRPVVPLDVYLAADEIMDYVDAVRP